MKAMLSLIITPLLLYSLPINDTKKKNENFFTKKLDKIETNLNFLHERLNNSSKYLDEFITNEIDDKIYYDSYIRIENSLEKKESQSLDFEPNIDIKIHLPKLKEKLSFTIDNNENINNKNNDYNVGLLYNTIKNDINLKFRLGVKTSTTPYLYTKAEVKKVFKFNSRNNITLEEKIKYSYKYELDNYSILEYKYNINKSFDFFNYNEYHINSDIKNDNLYNSLRLYQKLNNNKYINYVTSINSNDYQSNLKIKEYKTYVSYRSYIRKWLYYDVIPSISWDEKYDFNKKLALKFNLGILIKK